MIDSRDGGRRRDPAALASRAVQLHARGMSNAEIGQSLGISARYVQKLRANYKDFEAKLPKTAIEQEHLADEVKACLQPTADGFKRFYERYSGYYLPDHGYDWVKQALEHDRVLINCPPRHAKSKIFSVWMVMWLVAMDRDIQILVISQTVDLARKFTREIAYHFENNTKLISELGRFMPMDESAPWRPGSGELLVEGRRREVLPGDLTIQTRGAGQQILGMEARWIIVDDPCSRENSKSEVEREKLSDWFHGDVMTRQQGDGRVVVIGQRLGLGDLYGELADKNVDGAPAWHHINYPAVLQWPDPAAGVEAKVLWPEEWPFDKLMKRRADVTRKGGTGLWETMFMQNPVASDEVLVPREWIFGEPGCLDRERPLGTGLTEDQRKCRILTLDPSPTKFAGLICADIGSGRDLSIHIVDIMRERMGVREMINNIEEMRFRYGPIDYLIVETNSARFFLQGEDFRRWQESSGVRLVTHNTSRNKQDPEWGVLSLAGDFEFGRIRMPYDGPEARRVMEPLIYELTTYPFADTDDLVMALWFAKYNWRRLPPVIREQPKVGGGQGWGFSIPDRLASGFAWARGE